jgi:hypothetical protein
MNSDQSLIQSAYEDAVKKLFATHFESYAQSGGDAAQQQQADQNFKAGIGFARQSRDRTIALLD